jgi:hypothetical protein
MLDGPSVQTAPDGYRPIVWMIIGMIKAHPMQNRMPRQATRQLGRPKASCTAAGRCCPGSIRMAGCSTDPIPADCRGRVGGALLAWIAVRRQSARRHPRRDSVPRWPRRRDVTLDQLGHPAHLQATERSDGLEDNQDTPWVASQMAQLHIPLGNHDLEGVIGPTEPHRHRVRAAVLAIGRQHCRRRNFQQRPQPFDPSLAHLRERSGKLRMDGRTAITRSAPSSFSCLIASKLHVWRAARDSNPQPPDP